MKTRVHFRIFPEGDVIALFPDEPASCCNDGNIMGYQHVGQHGATSKELITYLQPATPEQYASLLNELTRIGYDLEILQ